MFTDKKNVAIAVLSGIVLIGALLMGKFAYEQHKALDSANVASAADAAKVRQFEDDRIAISAADTAQQKSAQAAQSNVKTTAQAVRTIVQYVPMPAAASTAPPQTIVIAKTDLGAAEQAKVPDSPSYELQTQDAAVATAKTLIQCSADQSSLKACHAEGLDLSGENIVLKGEVATWQNVAKGGSKSKRFWKFVGCAATTAGGAYAGSLTKQPKYAVIGAVGGFTACQFLF